jgi:Prokaryotic lipoprotein-attachment site
MRVAALLTAILLAGCGQSGPQSAMPARSWEYYVANPAEIEPMQKICRSWSGSSAPAASQPAVVTTNCRAAAFAKSQLQLTK